jgi:hypothetical protein
MRLSNEERADALADARHEESIMFRYTVYEQYLCEYRDRYLQPFLNSTTRSWVGELPPRAWGRYGWLRWKGRMFLLPNTTYEITEGDLGGKYGTERYFTIKVGSLGFINVKFDEFISMIALTRDLETLVTEDNDEFEEWVDEAEHEAYYHDWN